MNDIKTCNRCIVTKPLDEFYYEDRISVRDGSSYKYYRPDCKDCTKEKAVIWAENNREKWLKKCIAQNNKPENKIKQDEAKRAHRESGKYKVWQQNNPDKVKSSNQKYSNKKHKVSPTEWDYCRLYFDYRCAYCAMTYEYHYHKYKQDLHKEHVIHNGSNKIDNCVPSCRNCNSSKGEYEMESWYKKKHYFNVERLNKIYQWLNSDWVGK